MAWSLTAEQLLGSLFKQRQKNQAFGSDPSVCYLNHSSKHHPIMPWSKYTDLYLSMAYIAIILISTLYTHHSYHKTLSDCSKQYILQELASIQIAGVILASITVSAIKSVTTRIIPRHYSTHPMIPQAAARRRQQLPLV
jgi:predicted anti-sigma-YlaC factor YlaD